MVHKIFDVIGHVIWQPYCCFFLKENLKNFLCNVWKDRGETSHIWPPIHEEQKGHTYDVIGHMVWQPYWIYLKTYKNTPLKRSPGKGLQSLIALFLVPWCFHHIKWTSIKVFCGGEEAQYVSDNSFKAMICE